MANVVSASGFTAKSGTVYFMKDSEISKTPDMNTPAGTADKFASAALTGVSDRNVWRISSGGNEYYVKSEDVTNDKSIMEKEVKKEKAEEAARKKAEEKRNREALDKAVSNEKSKAYSGYQKKIEEEQEKEEQAARKRAAAEEAKKRKLAQARREAAKEKTLAAAEAKASEATGASSDTSARFKNASSNAEKIWIYLTEHGMSDTVAAAALGNIQAESDFNPRATDGGTGLVQWTSGRVAKLKAYAGASGMWTIEGQMSFLLHEFATSEAGAYAKIAAADSPAEAAYVWDRYYERSAGLSTSTRMRNATKWYNTFHASSGN